MNVQVVDMFFNALDESVLFLNNEFPRIGIKQFFASS